MNTLNRQTWPIAVVGGGVVGCAILREFALAGVTGILLEQGSDILSGASKANSALLHTGYDTDYESLEFECIQKGRYEYLRVMEELNLPMLETSALLVARDSEQVEKVGQLHERTLKKGITDIEYLEKSDVQNRYPWLVPDIVAGIKIKGENVIDPWSTALAYATHAIENGATILRSCKVLDGTLNDGVWQIQTNRGEIRAGILINAAGIYADYLERIRGVPNFTIKPRKGQFVVFDKAASKIVDTIILPVPGKRSKGVLLAPTIFGNVICGPTSEEQDNRVDSSVENGVLEKLVKFATSTVPGLDQIPVTAVYAGIRTATEYSDYQIKAYPDSQWISVAGIRSTGLTAALGIANYVADLYSSNFQSLQNAKSPKSVSVPNLAEHRERPYQVGGHGEIVCHCERVTRAEIQNALSSTLPARDIQGLKRRTRCLMGRCQGFYCGWRVWQLTSDKIYWPSEKGVPAENEEL